MVEILGYVVAGHRSSWRGWRWSGCGWPATWSGMAALAAALAGAFLYPGLGASGLGGAFWDGLGTSGEVLYVLGGLLLYNLLSAGGAVERMSGFLGRLEPEGEALALVVVVGVAPLFFESVTGFGVAGGDQRAYPARGGLLATSGRGAIELGAVRGRGRVGIGTGDRGGPLRHELRGASDLSALLSLPLSPSTPSPP